MSYLENCLRLQKEFKSNFDMIMKRNHVAATPAPAEAVDAEWPAEIRNFYNELNGMEIRWQPVSHPDEPAWSGFVRILAAKDVASSVEGITRGGSVAGNASAGTFHLFDFFIDEAAVGFYAGEESGELYLYLFEGEPVALRVDAAGYLELLAEARGFFYWQQALVAISSGKENAEARNFRERMPTLFPDFSYEKFVETYRSLQIN